MDSENTTTIWRDRTITQTEQDLMAQPKFDGVVEAVHYQPDGQVGWVRLYLRRGPTFSDRLILDRKAFVDLLAAGKTFYAGYRIPLMATTFEVSEPIHLLQDGDHAVLVTGDKTSDKDDLKGVPVI